MKKYSIFALAFVLSAGLLTGCRSNVPQTTTSPTTKATTAPTTKATTEATTEMTTEPTTDDTTMPIGDEVLPDNSGDDIAEGVGGDATAEGDASPSDNGKSGRNIRRKF